MRPPFWSAPFWRGAIQRRPACGYCLRLRYHARARRHSHGHALPPRLDLLEQYAEYHRDRRNIVTHFVGVPMIVFGVGVLLARPTSRSAGSALTPAGWLFALVAACGT